jgi:hypothetical protein
MNFLWAVKTNRSTTKPPKLIISTVMPSTVLRSFKVATKRQERKKETAFPVIQATKQLSIVGKEKL